MQRSKFHQTSVHKDIVHFDNIDKIPINNSERRCTDILCTIVGLAFTIALAIFAILLFNNPNYQKLVFPADSDGFTCGHENIGFGILYFAKPNSIANRVCVRACPINDKNPLSCKKTKSIPCGFGASMTYYQNEHVVSNYGEMCLPKDKAMRAKLEQQMHSHQKDLYYNSVKVIYKSLAVVGIISILYMFLVQCMPKIMNRAAVVVGALALIGLLVTIAIYPSTISSLTRWITFAVLLILVIVLGCTLVTNFKNWGLNGVMLDFATQFMCHRLYFFVLPIVFLALSGAFYLLQLFQYRSFWSFGELSFDPSLDLYHKIKSPTRNYILSFFQVIQILWGTMFLKESFNYLVSSDAVQWYYSNPCKCFNGLFTLVCKHAGSVIACSFMNAFFGIFDFIADALVPEVDKENDNACMSCVKGLAGFFDLARSDALTIVYLSGTAFCNSARYSEYLAFHNKDTRQTQSLSRIYRYTSHFAVGGVICILAFWILGSQTEVSVSAMLIMLIMSMGVATFFISIHADASEAILILYLMEHEFAQTRHSMSKATGKYDEIKSQMSKHLSGQKATQEKKI